MYTFADALQVLARQLTETAWPQRGGLRRLTVPLLPAERESVLRWLAAQPLWPQLWWVRRDDSEAAAVCGAVSRFRAMQQAEAFLRNWGGGQPDMRLWGANRFPDQTGIHSDLFLPRLEWYDAAASRLTLTLFSETSLAEDAQEACRWLAALQPPLHALPFSATVLHETAIPDRAGWRARIALALEAIQRRTLDKVVLARVSKLTLDRPLNPAALMMRSQQVNQHCYHYMLRLSETDAFLGSSPERLWFRHQDHLETEALAGTIASSADPQTARALAQQLLHDPKNRHENQLVVKDITRRLRAIAHTIRLAKRDIVTLRNVQHLRRRITAVLSDRNDSACLARLQPTAAVAGLPRRAACQFILQHEPFTRDWYAGSVGYLSRNQSEFCVALRSARLLPQRVLLYAGAGIVAGSEADAEWREIDNKAAGLRSLFFADSQR